MALTIIRRVIKNNRKFNLVLDMRGYSVSNLSLHRMWAVDFKESKEVTRHVERVAVIGGDSASFKAERELLESDRLRFFTTMENALKWMGLPT